MSDVSEIGGFTPGPWTIDPHSSGVIIIDSSACEIARVFGEFSNGTAKFARANAQLIAVAPDMHAEIALLRAHTSNMEEWKAEIGVQADEIGRLHEQIARLRREKAALVDVLETIASLANEDLYHGDVDGKPTNTATQMARAALRSATEKGEPT